MSFDGDLEHLPIVDVIQLLHATGKSGTLSLASLKGESQLVFADGFIVSANHVNNSVRIGQILLDMGMITPEELKSALLEQQKAGPFRKPIIQTMIEDGRVQPEVAYQGLEVLIELTIVEILTWTRGTFSLDIDKTVISDEYRYFPEQLKRQIQLNTQSILMDALRIYDERKRDGTLTPEAMFGTPAEDLSPAELSVIDLGLDDLDGLERRIPRPFSGLSDLQPDTAAKRLQPLLAGIPGEEQQRLFRYLEGLEKGIQPPGDGTGVILVTGEKLVREWVAAVSGQRFLFATDSAAELDPMIDHALSKGRSPLVVVDAGEPGSRGGAREGMVAVLQQTRAKYPELTLILLSCPGDYRLAIGALQAGTSAVLPRSSREERPESLVADTIDCAQALDRYLAGMRSKPERLPLQQVKEQFVSLSEKPEPAEVTFRLLQAAANFFERVVTLVVLRTELVAERGIGIDSPVKLRITTGQPSLLQQALSGESYYGDADQLVRETVFGTLGAPASQTIMLLPVLSFGRVIALIYGDFGKRPGGTPQYQLLETMALHAGLLIDNGLYRKRAQQTAM